MDSPKLKTISHDFLLDKMRVFYSETVEKAQFWHFFELCI